MKKGGYRHAPILRRFIVQRRRKIGILYFLGFAMAAAVVASSSLYGSSSKALGDSVKAEHADRSYAIQSGNLRAAQTLTSREEFEQIKEERGFLTSGSFRDPVLVRTSSRPALRIAILLRGKPASSPSEATISERLANVQSLSLGDSASLDKGDGTSRRVRIVGVSVNPANVEDSTVTTTDPVIDPSEVTIWLSNKDPYSIAALKPMLDQRVASYQSLSAITAEAKRNQPESIAALHRLPWGLAVLFAVLLTAVLIFMFPAAQLDATSLIYAGMSPSRAWRILLSAAFMHITVGIFVGSIVTLVSANLFKVQISSLAGQRWVAVTTPWVSIALLALATVLVAVLLHVFAIRIARLRGQLPALQSGRIALFFRISLIAALSGTAILSVSLISSLQPRPGQLSLLAPYGAALVAGAFPFLVLPISGFRQGPALRAVSRHLGSGISVITAATAVMVVLITAYSATTTHNAYANEGLTNAPQPPGSLLLTPVSKNAAQQISDAYKEVGGRKMAQFDIPDERMTQVRVTGTKLVQCMQSNKTLSPDNVPAICFPQATYTPVNTVVLSTDPGRSALADPGLVENGKVGLLIYSRADEDDASRLADTAANAEDSLGGNMPGLVLPTGSATAARFSLRPSGARLVAFLDFFTLTRTAQSQVRATVARLAPSAQIADGTMASGYDNQRSVANAVAVSGAALTLLIVLLGGTAIITGNRSALRVLVDIGATYETRRGLGLRWVSIPIFSITLAVLLARASASVSGLNATADFGWLWLCPGVLSVLGCLALFGYFIKVPRREVE